MFTTENMTEIGELRGTISNFLQQKVSDMEIFLNHAMYVRLVFDRKEEEEEKVIYLKFCFIVDFRV
jgi:hypothetical protein